MSQVRCKTCGRLVCKENSPCPHQYERRRRWWEQPRLMPLTEAWNKGVFTDVPVGAMFTTSEKPEK